MIKELLSGNRARIGSLYTIIASLILLRDGLQGGAIWYRQCDVRKALLSRPQYHFGVGDHVLVRVPLGASDALQTAHQLTIACSHRVDLPKKSFFIERRSALCDEHLKLQGVDPSTAALAQEVLCPAIDLSLPLDAIKIHRACNSASLACLCVPGISAAEIERGLKELTANRTDCRRPGSHDAGASNHVRNAKTNTS